MFVLLHSCEALLRADAEGGTHCPELDDRLGLTETWRYPPARIDHMLHGLLALKVNTSLLLLLLVLFHLLLHFQPLHALILLVLIEDLAVITTLNILYVS